MKSLLITDGLLNAFLAIFHMMFWKMFNWKESLQSLDSLQRAIVQVLNIHLILAIVLFAYLSLFKIEELVSTGIGKTILLFIAVFYFIRIINQFIFFDMSYGMSWAIVVLCLVLAVLYGVSWKLSL
jgi:hypothetical protein